MTTAAIAQFIRHLPLSSLKACLGCYVPLLAANINWPDDAQQLTAIFKKLYKKNCPTHEEMHLLAERVNGMTDEEGQAALACSVQNKPQFNALQNAHERAAWVLMHEPSAFRHAEEIRYADLNRRGQMWDSFTAPRDKVIRDDANSIKRFRKRLHQIFPDSQNILVEMYTRLRQEPSGEPVKIYQTSIYIESRPESYMALENSQIVTKTRRPLQEIIICYAAAAGTIEIIAAAKEQRDKVALAFHEEFLTSHVTSMVLSNDYDLSSLMKEQSFPTDMDDNIKAVSILSIKLRSISGDGTITIEVPNRHDRMIYPTFCQTAVTA